MAGVETPACRIDQRPMRASANVPRHVFNRSSSLASA